MGKNALLTFNKSEFVQNAFANTTLKHCIFSYNRNDCVKNEILSFSYLEVLLKVGPQFIWSWNLGNLSIGTPQQLRKVSLLAVSFVYEEIISPLGCMQGTSNQKRFKNYFIYILDRLAPEKCHSTTFMQHIIPQLYLI